MSALILALTTDPVQLRKWMLSLPSRDWKVRSVANREDLALCLRPGHADAALCDADHPVMPTGEILRAADPIGLPVIVTLRSVDRSRWLELIHMGAFDVLPAPIEPDELLARIQTALQRSSRPSPPRGILPRLRKKLLQLLL